MDDTKVFAALSEPTRRVLFERILEAPRSVGELVRTVAVTQPAVSQHLKVLRAAGLVTVERRGAQRIYRVRREGLEGPATWFDECLAAIGPKATA